MKTRIVRRILKGVLFVIVATAVLGGIVMGLWNALIPGLFHGPELGFWQAIGLLLLAHILLRGWGPWRYGHGWRHEHWRRRMEERLAAMTPEERSRMREEWGCHHRGSAEKSDA